MPPANQSTRVCYRCGTAIDAVARIGRRDSCLKCGNDLHCCRNCRFYDVHYNNHCMENQAERQVEKEAGNFCEYFEFRVGTAAAAAGGNDSRAKLEALFRKK